MYSLDKLPLNQPGIITNLELPPNIKKRLLNFGLIENTKITPLYISPSGDPRAYQFRNSLIAIRKKEAKKIFVNKVSN